MLLDLPSDVFHELLPWIGPDFVNLAATCSQARARILHYCRVVLPQKPCAERRLCAARLGLFALVQEGLSLRLEEDFRNEIDDLPMAEIMFQAGLQGRMDMLDYMHKLHLPVTAEYIWEVDFTHGLASGIHYTKLLQNYGLDALCDDWEALGKKCTWEECRNIYASPGEFHGDNIEGLLLCGALEADNRQVLDHVDFAFDVGFSRNSTVTYRYRPAPGGAQEKILVSLKTTR